MSRDTDELLRAQREQEALRRAASAREVLDNPLIKEAWDAIRNATVRGLEDQPLDGSTGKNDYALELVRILQANRRHRIVFEHYVSTGQLLEAQLLQRETVLGDESRPQTH